MRRSAVPEIIIRVAFVWLVRVRCCGEAVKRVVVVIVCAGAVNHLRDVVDGVELILEVGQRVRGLCVC